MKFKIDENLPSEFTGMLRSAGHDSVTVLEEELSGAPDAEVFATCRLEERTFMSLDLDFSDIRLYPPAGSEGIVVFRIQPQDKNHLLACLQRIVPLMDEDALRNKLWIVEEARIRVRE